MLGPASGTALVEPGNSGGRLAGRSVAPLSEHGEYVLSAPTVWAAVAWLAVFWSENQGKLLLPTSFFGHLGTWSLAVCQPSSPPPRIGRNRLRAYRDEPAVHLGPFWGSAGLSPSLRL